MRTGQPTEAVCVGGRLAGKAVREMCHMTLLRFQPESADTSSAQTVTPLGKSVSCKGGSKQLGSCCSLIQ